MPPGLSAAALAAPPMAAVDDVPTAGEIAAAAGERTILLPDTEAARR